MGTKFAQLHRRLDAEKAASAVLAPPRRSTAESPQRARAAACPLPGQALPLATRAALARPRVVVLLEASRGTWFAVAEVRANGRLARVAEPAVQNRHAVSIGIRAGVGIRG